MNFPKNVFHAYDIRGLAETELSADLAEAVGRGFVEFLKEKKVKLARRKIVVGRDMRLSSPELETALIRGLTSAGAEVVKIGLASTPLFNFACAHYPEHAGGIMVTASHNPGGYNGFKLTLENGLPIGQSSGMDQLRDLVLANKFSNATTPGQVTEQDVLPDYLERLFSLVPPAGIKPLKIVVDAGNGMAKVTVPEMLKKLPVQAEYLYLEPDGNFPNHEANPLKVETLKNLQAKVVATGADFGLALDGDCDRLGLVDETGEIVEASYVGALVGLEVLKKHPGSLMLYDLRSSAIVAEIWEANGASTKKCIVGHANIKKAMKDTGASFASELSEHLYFQDMYDVESSDLALLYFCQLLSESGKKLSALVKPLKKYWHSGEINFKTAAKEEVFQALEEKYGQEAVETSKMDGLWLGFDWGWFNVRASNTEPVLRLNLEAKTKETMQAKLEEITKLINSF